MDNSTHNEARFFSKLPMQAPTEPQGITMQFMLTILHQMYLVSSIIQKFIQTSGTSKDERTELSNKLRIVLLGITHLLSPF